MTALLKKARRGETLAGLDIVDMHGHIGRYMFAIPDLSTAGLVRVMGRIGVSAIVVSHMHCMTGEAALGNRIVLEAMHAHPGRILGYAAFWPGDSPGRAEAERAFDDGFAGIKLHNANGFPYTDPDYAAVLGVANERCASVLLHTQAHEKTFEQVRELSKAYPQASLLLAHAGSGDEAGYAKLARECANVYLDVTMSKTPMGLVERLVRDAGVEKVVFGSDAYFINMAQAIGKVLGARISDDEKVAVVSRNARRILGRVAKGR
jgi:hypothetical protein